MNEHTHKVRCYQSGRSLTVFGHRVKAFKCPVCGRSHNIKAMSAVCTGKVIRKEKRDPATGRSIEFNGGVKCGA